MRAGLIGAVAFGAAVAVALTWINLARVAPEPHADRPAESPASLPGPPPGGGVASGDPAVPAPDENGTAPAAGPDRLAAIAPEPPVSAGLPAGPGRDTAAPDAAVPLERGAEARAPSLDIVRVDADGQTVIAGRTAPNERVEVLLDGQVVETMLADAGGRFVAVLAAGPSAEPRELRLRITLSHGADGADAPDGAAGTEAAEAADGAPPDAPQVALASADAPSAPLHSATPEERPGEPEGREGRLAGLAGLGSADGETSVGPGDGIASAEPARPGAAPKAAARAEQDGIGAGPASDEGGAGAPARPTGPADSRHLLSDAVIMLPSGPGDQAPALVQAQDDGLAMLQPGGADATGVVLDQLTQGPGGDLLLRGRARPGHAVRIYANGQAIETVAVADGGWSLAVPAAEAEGIRLFRLDEIARSGEVASRIEVPYDPSGAATQVVRGRRITIQRGDNLWRIAEQHYGDGIRYSLIFGANSDLIRDPDLIYPDQVFTVPELVEAD